LLVAVALWVLALPILVMDFVGQVGIAWNLIGLALMATGALVFWRERQRARKPPPTR